MSNPTRTVDVYADVLCPFTHVGLHRLFALRDELGRDDVVIRVRAWPLELVNGELLAAELLEEEIAELRTAVAPDLFTGFDATRFPMSSLPPLALAERAYRDGTAVGERMSRALRDALFEDGRDLADLSVLAAIADELGVSAAEDADRAAVLADHERGRGLGVEGSPHFVVGSASFFCPTLDIERVDGRLRISYDEQGLTAFLGTVFAP